MIEYSRQFFFDPASASVRSLIVSGVEELVRGYDIAGVLFDDYFYPTTSAEFDAESYSDYTAGAGMLSLAQFRLQNVSTLIAQTYAAVKKADNGVLFAVSPDASISRNLSRHYADVKTWCSEAGYIDAIVPQIYFGFENQTMPFAAVCGSGRSFVQVHT